MLIQNFISKIYPRLFHPRYQRELFTLADGQQIALDWTYPARFDVNRREHSRPIVVGMYGITGDSHSLNILRYCKLLSHRLRFLSVVLGRRGHERDIPLTVPRMCVFGLQDDIHAVVLHIHDKYPNAPLVLLGDSAGTGFWVRYTGDLSLSLDASLQRMHTKSSPRLEVKQYERARVIHDKLLCSVLISPGYDINEVFANQSWLTKKLLLFLLKDTFVQKHGRVLRSHKNSRMLEKCSNSQCALEFFRTYSGHLSGYDSYDEFLMQTNPTETGKYAQIPALIINSRDDPICTAESLDEWKWLFTAKESCPNAILLETKYGSHSSFFTALGGFWLDSIILDYVKAVYQIKRNQNRNRNVQSL